MRKQTLNNTSKGSPVTYLPYTFASVLGEAFVEHVLAEVGTIKNDDELGSGQMDKDMANSTLWTVRAVTDLYNRIGTCVSLPPLAVAQRMEVTVEERAESDSETKFSGRKHPLGLGLGLPFPSPLQL